MDPPTSTVTPRCSVPDLREIDQQILAILEYDGRATPRYLSNELENQTSYLNQRLAFLVDEDLVERIDRGLYEINCEVTQ